MTKVSIIIPSVSGNLTIDECLVALEGQRGEVEAEIIVVDRCQDGTAEHIRRHFGWVRLVSLTKQSSIPEMRAIGMAQATGDIIIITEDHCIAPDNWLEEIVKAHQSGYMAVGGAVENGCVERVTDWATFLCEYSHAMLPIPFGEVSYIAGNNASYARELLAGIDESIKKNYWEFFLHEELQKRGVRFLSVPTIVVNHKKEFEILYFLLQKFHYSRSFAAMRRTKLTRLKHVCCLCATPLLPFMLLWRTFRQVMRKRRHYKEFVLSLPLLSLFGVSYACGELVGYLCGSGRSLVKVE